MGRWTGADIVAYLKTGHNAITAATGLMGEEVTLSSSQMTDEDLAAIAVYLKDQTREEKEPAHVPPPAAVMQAGGAIYADVCSACHGADGKGVPALFPALATSANVLSEDPSSLIRIVLEGARSAATAREPTAAAMPAFGWQLNDQQVAAVLTYVRNHWAASANTVTSGDVGRARARLGASMN